MVLATSAAERRESSVGGEGSMERCLGTGVEGAIC